MLVVKLEQGSEEWFEEKLGKPSASNCSKIITNEGKKSTQRKGYLYELAGEIITKRREDGYKNKFMEGGNEREEESRTYYELITGTEVEPVGVIYKNKEKKFLCSPDGIVTDQKIGLEMKNPIAKTQVQYLLEQRVPTIYMPQIQFSLYVTGFKHWDFLSYVPDMKPLLIRVERDKEFIAKLDEALKVFCADLDNIVNQIK